MAGAKTLLTLAILSTIVSFSKADDDPWVIDVLGSCRPYNGSLCANSLEEGKPVFIPDRIVLSNNSVIPVDGTRLMESYLQSALGAAAFWLDRTDQEDDINSTACTKELRRQSCPGVFLECEEVDMGGVSKAVPVLSCLTVCKQLWGICSELFQLAELFGIELGHCNYLDDGRWEIIPDFPRLSGFGASYLHFYPKEFVGMTTYQDERYSVEFGVNRTEEFECNPFAGKNEMASCEMECNYPLKKNIDGDTCSCGVACPVSPFEDMSGLGVGEDTYPLAISVRIERAVVSCSLPFLVLISFMELRNAWSGREVPNPFILLCCFTGLIYCCMVLALVHEDQTGCNKSGTFSVHWPMFWSQRGKQYNTCALMTCAVHILQVFINSMLCTLIQLHVKFVNAINYTTSEQAYYKWVYFVLIVVVPGFCSLMTYIFGREKSELVFDDHFLLMSVRYLYRCGPIYHNPALEAAFVTVPIMVSVLVCAVLGIRLHMICMRILYTVEGQEYGAEKVSSSSSSTKNAAYARYTSRLARQMVLVSFVMLLVLFFQIPSEIYLRSSVAKYSNQTNGMILCNVLLQQNLISQCEKPQMLSQVDFWVLVTNSTSWSLLPLTFGVLFTTALCMKSNKRRAKVHTATKQPHTTSHESTPKGVCSSGVVTPQ